MKKLLITLSLLYCITLHAQEIYNGQLLISNKRFSVVHGQLEVSMKINFERLRLDSRQEVTLTPILRNNENSLTLPVIHMRGKNYKLANNKDESNSEKRTPAIVLFATDKNKSNFQYKIKTPYKDWMNGADIIISTYTQNNKGFIKDSIGDIIASNIILPESAMPVKIESGIDGTILSLVNFLEPQQHEINKSIYKSSIPFGNLGFAALSEEKQNYEIYYQLREVVNQLSSSGSKIDRIKLTGYGSPSGNLHRNERDAAVRALSLKNYLRENRVAGKTPMEVTWVAEDWDSVTSVVSHSDMMFRDAVLDIISTVDVSKGRERMLMNLADGIPYKYLLENVFPTVRRMDYEIQYTREPLDTDESRRLMAAGSRQLSLSEFFAVANSYPKGSAEYNDALDLAARLFPDSPEANINAAAVALSRKDKVRARRYLERFSTLPEAYNNMGILCMMEGNRDKAEVYLEMAAASGVTQAQKTLKELKLVK